MSIQGEITRLSGNVNNTLAAIAEMGGTVPTGATSDDMAVAVRSIPTGGNPLDAYPIGSIYMSVNSTDPADLFGGGDWTQLKGRFLIGTGTPDKNTDGTSPGSYNHAGGKKGGAATVKIETKNFPWQTTVLSQYGSVNGIFGREQELGSNAWGFSAMSDVYKNTSGSVYADGTDYGVAMDNMPPYLAVYMWKRVR